MTKQEMVALSGTALVAVAAETNGCIEVEPKDADMVVLGYAVAVGPEDAAELKAAVAALKEKKGISTAFQGEVQLDRGEPVRGAGLN